MKAKNNRTITLTEREKNKYKKGLIFLNEEIKTEAIINKIINQDLFSLFDYLPTNFVDFFLLTHPITLVKTIMETNFTKCQMRSIKSGLKFG